VKKGLLTLGFVAATFIAPAAFAQSLPNQVQALYPAETGEVVFADLRALRGSVHYPLIKTQVLPERFRQLEVFGSMLGIEFERSVHQLSWGFVGQPGGEVAFVGVAEGSFSTGDVEARAKKQRLATTKFGNALVVVLGKGEQGQEFVFAFPDRSLAVFGHREAVEPMLTRHAQGGSSLLENAALRRVMDEVNGKAPLWVALDNPYTQLAIKQMLPEAIKLPGFEGVAGKLQSTSLRIELKEGLNGRASVRCATSSDAVLLSTLVQAALTYQGYQLTEKNPEMARAVKESTVTRNDDRVDLAMTILTITF
jgi:hypothetical protein